MSVPISNSTTGTNQFNPAASSLILYAYSLINMRGTQIVTEHLIDGAMAANFAMIEMSNRNPMRFALETLSTGVGNSFTTSIATVSGNTLEFSTSPGNIIGFYVTDITVENAIPANTTVLSITGSGPYTVTLSGVATGVSLGDSITFSELAPITQGTAVYTLPRRTLAISIVTIATSSGQSLVERVLGPISAYEYQAMPNKNTQAPPTAYFFSLLKTPTITFWETPDNGGPYQANIQTFRQLQDIDLTNGYAVDSPYRYLDALVTNIAARLAESYAPAKADRLYAQYEARMSLAQGRDQETVSLSILPGLGSYYQIR